MDVTDLGIKIDAKLLQPLKAWKLIYSKVLGRWTDAKFIQSLNMLSATDVTPSRNVKDVKVEMPPNEYEPKLVTVLGTTVD